LPMAARASSYCPAASSTQGGDWTRDEDRGSGSSGCGGRGADDSGSSGSRPDLAGGPDDGCGSASSDYGGRGAGSSASSRSRRLWGPTATTTRPTRDPDQLRLRGAQRRRLGQLQLQGPQRHLRPPSSR
jgi:hypothetical protein